MEFIVESDKGNVIFAIDEVSFNSILFPVTIFWSICLAYLFYIYVFVADLLEGPIPPEMVIFYITQDTQRHPLLPELKSGLLLAY